jgi:succinate-semialdehyde dehydrogenase/glutarate-semialdehyde dehydrogenase
LRGCDIIEWDATEGLRFYGRVIPSEEGMRHTVLRQPIGPVAAFSPWNFPMSSPSRKVAGALSSGCSIILKASEETPAGAVQLVRAFHDAGLPPGVLNLVFGNPAEISNYLIPQSSIRLITFTGSIPVGKALAEMAGRHMKPAIMELGGHAPVIVCEERRSGHDRRDIRHGQVAQRRPSLRFADPVLCPGIDLSAFCRCVRRKGCAIEGRRWT